LATEGSGKEIFMREVWKDIPGFEQQYQVSNLGRVRSLPRIVMRKHRFMKKLVPFEYKGKVLSAKPKECGHLNVSLGANKTRLVHRLVLLACVGEAPVGCEARHLNGIPHDNRLENLKWDTRLENRKDISRHAQLYRRRQGSTWLTEDTIKKIKRELKKPNRPTMRDLAEKYGVHFNTISNINRGYTHKWVDA
jgi:hypothetical protein